MKKRSETAASDAAQSVETFVLAGARASGDDLAAAHNVASKAYIKVAGKTMLFQVLEALNRSRSAGKVQVIGLPQSDTLETDETWPPIQFTDGDNGPAASVFRAFSALNTTAPVLVTTCDHVLLTPEMIDQFLDESRVAGADLTVALARRSVIEAEYPNVKRTYLRFGDGEYSSCNLFCLATPAARDVVKFWQTAEQDRKRPWRIAWRFGLVAASRILIGRPDLARVFEIVSQRLGVTIRPIVLPFADAAVDVDTKQDLALVEQVLSRRDA